MTRSNNANSSIALLLVDNAHIYRTPDGRYYSSALYDIGFFLRYLKVFNRVRFLAKTRYVEKVDPEKHIPLSVPGLEIHELPWTQGLKGLIKKLPLALTRYISAHRGADCAIYRVSQLESYLAYMCRDRKAPFFLEVVNDPETFIHLRPALRYVNQRMLRLMLGQASGASFVTKRILQAKYLTEERHALEDFVTSHYSSIELNEEWFSTPLEFKDRIEKLHLAHISNSIDNDIKGHEPAIRIVAKLKERGVDASISFIGDGSYVEQLKQMAAGLGISDRVHFVGRINGRHELLGYLSQFDLFLYPTRLEGLPRAVIEAMAVGLPVLSTPIAGIPELLAPEYMFEPDDIDGFAGAVARLRARPEELGLMSKTNIDKAREYSSDILDARRTDFYSRLKSIVARRGAPAVR